MIEQGKHIALARKLITAGMEQREVVRMLGDAGCHNCYYIHQIALDRIRALEEAP